MSLCLACFPFLCLKHSFVVQFCFCDPFKFCINISHLSRNEGSKNVICPRFWNFVFQAGWLWWRHVLSIMRGLSHSDTSFLNTKMMTISNIGSSLTILLRTCYTCLTSSCSSIGSCTWKKDSGWRLVVVWLILIIFKSLTLNLEQEKTCQKLRWKWKLSIRLDGIDTAGHPLSEVWKRVHPP